LKKKVLLFSFFSIFVFLNVIIFFGYKVYTLQKENFLLQKQVVFYETFQKSKKFFNAVIKEYNSIKPEVIKKHKFVLNHMDKDIFKLKKQFGKNWHIYKTDKNLIIRETTFKYDQNFSLAFLKDNLFKHTTTIGISSIICDGAISEFFVYSDSYQNKKVLEIGYILSNPTIKKFKNELKKIKSKNKWIKRIQLYVVVPSFNFAERCNFLQPLYNKKTKNPGHKYIRNGLSYYKELQIKNPVFKKDEMYILTKTDLDENTYIVYKIEINNDYYTKELNKLKIMLGIILFFIILLLAIILYYLNKIISIISNFVKAIKNEKPFEYKKNDEIKLIVNSYNNTLEKLKQLIESKEEFLHFALHELKTPLSVISLYANSNDYLLKSSIKMLTNSYNDMIYFSQMGDFKTEIKKFNLKDLVNERIQYFKDIAEVNEKEIIYNLEDCFINADKIDIERLIDNNIKNAIKYSTSRKIYINLKNCILEFINDGEIKNKEKIFDKFYREDKVQGGFGIGLSIIKSITEKYNIKIDLNSDKKVVFIYDFKEINENNNN